MWWTRRRYKICELSLSHYPARSCLQPCCVINAVLPATPVGLRRRLRPRLLRIPLVNFGDTYPITVDIWTVVCLLWSLIAFRMIFCNSSVNDTFWSVLQSYMYWLHFKEMRWSLYSTMPVVLSLLTKWDSVHSQYDYFWRICAYFKFYCYCYCYCRKDPYGHSICCWLPRRVARSDCLSFLRATSCELLHTQFWKDMFSLL
jgi:hypothetical protein